MFRSKSLLCCKQAAQFSSKVASKSNNTSWTKTFNQENKYLFGELLESAADRRKRLTIEKVNTECNLVLNVDKENCVESCENDRGNVNAYDDFNPGSPCEKSISSNYNGIKNSFSDHFIKLVSKTSSTFNRLSKGFGANCNFEVRFGSKSKLFKHPQEQSKISACNKSNTINMNYDFNNKSGPPLPIKTSIDNVACNTSKSMQVKHATNHEIIQSYSSTGIKQLNSYITRSCESFFSKPSALNSLSHGFHRLGNSCKCAFSKGLTILKYGTSFVSFHSNATQFKRSNFNDDSGLDPCESKMCNEKGNPQTYIPNNKPFKIEEIQNTNFNDDRSLTSNKSNKFSHHDKNEMHQNKNEIGVDGTQACQNFCNLHDCSTFNDSLKSSDQYNARLNKSKLNINEGNECVNKNCENLSLKLLYWSSSNLNDNIVNNKSFPCENCVSKNINSSNSSKFSDVEFDDAFNKKYLFHLSKGISDIKETLKKLTSDCNVNEKIDPIKENIDSANAVSGKLNSLRDLGNVQNNQITPFKNILNNNALKFNGKTDPGPSLNYFTYKNLENETKMTKSSSKCSRSTLKTEKNNYSKNTKILYVVKPVNKSQKIEKLSQNQQLVVLKKISKGNKKINTSENTDIKIFPKNKNVQLAQEGTCPLLNLLANVTDVDKKPLIMRTPDPGCNINTYRDYNRNLSSNVSSKISLENIDSSNCINNLLDIKYESKKKYSDKFFNKLIRKMVYDCAFTVLPESRNNNSSKPKNFCMRTIRKRVSHKNEFKKKIRKTGCHLQKEKINIDKKYDWIKDRDKYIVCYRYPQSKISSLSYSMNFFRKIHKSGDTFNKPFSSNEKTKFSQRQIYFPKTNKINNNYRSGNKQGLFFGYRNALDSSGNNTKKYWNYDMQQKQSHPGKKKIFNNFFKPRKEVNFLSPVIKPNPSRKNVPGASKVNIQDQKPDKITSDANNKFSMNDSISDDMFQFKPGQNNVTQYLNKNKSKMSSNLHHYKLDVPIRKKEILPDKLYFFGLTRYCKIKKLLETSASCANKEIQKSIPMKSNLLPQRSKTFRVLNYPTSKTRAPSTEMSDFQNIKKPGNLNGNNQSYYRDRSTSDNNLNKICNRSYVDRSVRHNKLNHFPKNNLFLKPQGEDKFMNDVVSVTDRIQRQSLDLIFKDSVIKKNPTSPVILDRLKRYAEGKHTCKVIKEQKVKEKDGMIINFPKFKQDLYIYEIFQKLNTGTQNFNKSKANVKKSSINFVRKSKSFSFNRNKKTKTETPNFSRVSKSIVFKVPLENEVFSLNDKLNVNESKFNRKDFFSHDQCNDKSQDVREIVPVNDNHLLNSESAKAKSFAKNKKYMSENSPLLKSVSSIKKSNSSECNRPVKTNKFLSSEKRETDEDNSYKFLPITKATGIERENDINEKSLNFNKDFLKNEFALKTSTYNRNKELQDKNSGSMKNKSQFSNSDWNVKKYGIKKKIMEVKEDPFYKNSENFLMKKNKMAVNDDHKLNKSFNPDLSTNNYNLSRSVDGHNLDPLQKDLIHGTKLDLHPRLEKSKTSFNFNKKLDEALFNKNVKSSVSQISKYEKEVSDYNNSTSEKESEHSKDFSHERGMIFARNQPDLEIRTNLLNLTDVKSSRSFEFPDCEDNSLNKNLSVVENIQDTNSTCSLKLPKKVTHWNPNLKAVHKNRLESQNEVMSTSYNMADENLFRVSRRCSDAINRCHAKLELKTVHRNNKFQHEPPQNQVILKDKSSVVDDPTTSTEILRTESSRVILDKIKDIGEKFLQNLILEGTLGDIQKKSDHDTSQNIFSSKGVEVLEKSSAQNEICKLKNDNFNHPVSKKPGFIDSSEVGDCKVIAKKEVCVNTNDSVGIELEKQDRGSHNTKKHPSNLKFLENESVIKHKSEVGHWLSRKYNNSIILDCDKEGKHSDTAVDFKDSSVNLSEERNYQKKKAQKNLHHFQNVRGLNNIKKNKTLNKNYFCHPKIQRSEFDNWSFNPEKFVANDKNNISSQSGNIHLAEPAFDEGNPGILSKRQPIKNDSFREVKFRNLNSKNYSGPKHRNSDAFKKKMDCFRLQCSRKIDYLLKDSFKADWKKYESRRIIVNETILKSLKSESNLSKVKSDSGKYDSYISDRKKRIFSNIKKEKNGRRMTIITNSLMNYVKSDFKSSDKHFDCNSVKNEDHVRHELYAGNRKKNCQEVGFRNQEHKNYKGLEINISVPRTLKDHGLLLSPDCLPEVPQLKDDMKISENLETGNFISNDHDKIINEYKSIDDEQMQTCQDLNLQMPLSIIKKENTAEKMENIATLKKNNFAPKTSIRDDQELDVNKTHDVMFNQFKNREIRKKLNEVKKNDVLCHNYVSKEMPLSESNASVTTPVIENKVNDKIFECSCSNISKQVSDNLELKSSKLLSTKELNKSENIVISKNFGNIDGSDRSEFLAEQNHLNFNDSLEGLRRLGSMFKVSSNFSCCQKKTYLETINGISNNSKVEKISQCQLQPVGMSSEDGKYTFNQVNNFKSCDSPEDVSNKITEKSTLVVQTLKSIITDARKALVKINQSAEGINDIKISLESSEIDRENSLSSGTREEKLPKESEFIKMKMPTFYNSSTIKEFACKPEDATFRKLNNYSQISSEINKNINLAKKLSNLDDKTSPFMTVNENYRRSFQGNKNSLICKNQSSNVSFKNCFPKLHNRASKMINSAFFKLPISHDNSQYTFENKRVTDLLKNNNLAIIKSQLKSERQQVNTAVWEGSDSSSINLPTSFDNLSTGENIENSVNSTTLKVLNLQENSHFISDNKRVMNQTKETENSVLNKSQVTNTPFEDSSPKTSVIIEESSNSASLKLPVSYDPSLKKSYVNISHDNKNLKEVKNVEKTSEMDSDSLVDSTLGKNFSSESFKLYYSSVDKGILNPSVESESTVSGKYKPSLNEKQNMERIKFDNVNKDEPKSDKNLSLKIFENESSCFNQSACKKDSLKDGGHITDKEWNKIQTADKNINAGSLFQDDSNINNPIMDSFSIEGKSEIEKVPKQGLINTFFGEFFDNPEKKLMDHNWSTSHKIPKLSLNSNLRSKPVMECEKYDNDDLFPKNHSSIKKNVNLEEIENDEEKDKKLTDSENVRPTKSVSRSTSFCDLHKNKNADFVSVKTALKGKIKELNEDEIVSSTGFQAVLVNETRGSTIPRLAIKDYNESNINLKKVSKIGQDSSEPENFENINGHLNETNLTREKKEDFDGKNVLSNQIEDQENKARFKSDFHQCMENLDSLQSVSGYEDKLYNIKNQLTEIYSKRNDDRVNCYADLLKSSFLPDFISSGIFYNCLKTFLLSKEDSVHKDNETNEQFNKPVVFVKTDEKDSVSAIESHVENGLVTNKINVLFDSLLLANKSNLENKSIEFSNEDTNRNCPVTKNFHEKSESKSDCNVFKRHEICAKQNYKNDFAVRRTADSDNKDCGFQREDNIHVIESQPSNEVPSGQVTPFKFEMVRSDEGSFSNAMLSSNLEDEEEESEEEDVVDNEVNDEELPSLRNIVALYYDEISKKIKFVPSIDEIGIKAVTVDEYYVDDEISENAVCRSITTKVSEDVKNFNCSTCMNSLQEIQITPTYAKVFDSWSKKMLTISKPTTETTLKCGDELLSVGKAIDNSCKILMQLKKFVFKKSCSRDKKFETLKRQFLFGNLKNFISPNPYLKIEKNESEKLKFDCKNKENAGLNIENFKNNFSSEIESFVNSVELNISAKNIFQQLMGQLKGQDNSKSLSSLNNAEKKNASVRFNLGSLCLTIQPNYLVLDPVVPIKSLKITVDDQDGINELSNTKKNVIASEIKKIKKLIKFPIKFEPHEEFFYSLACLNDKLFSKNFDFSVQDEKFYNYSNISPVPTTQCSDFTDIFPSNNLYFNERITDDNLLISKLNDLDYKKIVYYVPHSVPFPGVPYPRNPSRNHSPVKNIFHNQDIKICYCEPIFQNVSAGKSNLKSCSESKPVQEEKRYILNLSIPLEKVVDFPLINKSKTKLKYCFKEVINIDYNSTSHSVDVINYPSVTKILNDTMSEKSRSFLEQWRSRMIAQLGEEGFELMNKAKLQQGTNFHDCIKQYLLGTPIKELKYVPSNVTEILKSLESVLNRISDVAVVESEVIHSHLPYRGYVDCVAVYNGKPTLIEWKHSDKKKPYLSYTFDAPLQMSAYLGALNYDEKYKLPVQNGMVIVAYSDGSPADVFWLTSDACNRYWKLWLERLHLFLQSRIDK